MNVTIKDIAKQANVSTSTVSRVLNGQDNFYATKTAKKVHKAALKLGYRKNTNATELVTKKSNTIGVIMLANKTNFANGIVDGIQDEALHNELNVIIVHAGENDPVLQKKAIQTVTERPVKGLLIVGIELADENLQYLQQTGFPYLFISAEFSQDNVPFITTDNFYSAYTATQFLVDHGYRKIGLAGISDQSFMGKRRIAGYLDALKHNKINYEKNWLQPGNFSYQDGVVAIKKYQKNSNVDAVLCGSDYTALGVLNEAREHSLEVPGDLGIMSMDGTELAQYISPEITSIEQSFFEMGVKGAKMLQEDFANNFYQYIPFKIVEGNSTLK